MNLLQERKHHERKLAIIEMIELCDERMKNEEGFLSRTNITEFFNVCGNSHKNTLRFVKIKNYLIYRYEKNQQ